jgi:hypothetical protein
MARAIAGRHERADSEWRWRRATGKSAERGGGDMPRWMLLLVVGLTVLTTLTSSYTAYKVYQMTDGKAAATKGRR